MAPSDLSALAPSGGGHVPGLPAMSFDEDLKSILPQLRRHGMWRTRNRESMEDLVQDTVVRALTGRGSFQPGTNFGAWMHRILRNEFFSGMRSKRHTVSLDDPGAKVVSVAANQVDRLVMRDLSAALDRLPPTQREVVLLAALSDLSHDQISDSIGCRVGTVKSRLSRGRDRLRQEMDGDAPNDVALVA